MRSVPPSCVTAFRIATAFTLAEGPSLRVPRVHGFVTLSSCLLWRAALSFWLFHPATCGQDAAVSFRRPTVLRPIFSGGPGSGIPPAAAPSFRGAVDKLGGISIGLAQEQHMRLEGSPGIEPGTARWCCVCRCVRLRPYGAAPPYGKRNRRLKIAGAREPGFEPGFRRRERAAREDRTWHGLPLTAASAERG